jgi:site-specific recombinase
MAVAVHERPDGLDLALQGLARAASRTERLAALNQVMREGAQLANTEPGHLPLIERCEAEVEARATLARALTSLLRESTALGLLAEGGVPNDRGLFPEAFDRLARWLLPRSRDEGDLAHSLATMLHAGSVYAQLDDVSVESLHRLFVCLDKAGLDVRPLRQAAHEALLLLAVRVSALGLIEPMRARTDEPGVRASPFHLLIQRTQELLDALEGDAGPALEAWRACAVDVRRTCAGVHKNLERAGVSLDLVFAIDFIDVALRRMDRLAAVLAAADRERAAAAAATLWLELERARRGERSLRALLAQNLRLLARRVIERAGRTGEHYIAVTRAEYLALLASSAGGGLVTTLTAAIKLMIHALGIPLFVSGFLASLNYAVSFVAIQHLGCTLATKQPAMTAATLADIMQKEGPERIEELVTHVARIVRSQLAAALANVVFVAAGAWAFAALWRAMTGHAFLDEHEVDYVLDSLHPGHSLTIFYAALTGVLLWASSLIGGAIENWAVYRGLPQAIADHPLGDRIGVDRMRRLGRFVERNLSGWGVNVSLGFLLGMTPAVGSFLGLPLEVRHVTLTTGMLALALAALPGGGLHDPRLGMPLLGIAVIFVLNLGVSFGLALAVALRARDVQAADKRAFLRALLVRMLRSPLEFVLPPRANGSRAPRAG